MYSQYALMISMKNMLLYCTFCHTNYCSQREVSSSVHDACYGVKKFFQNGLLYLCFSLRKIFNIFLIFGGKIIV
ncbi:hypothetical protein Hanom_Chr05g00426381 [Helianthus anomalus]